MPARGGTPPEGQNHQVSAGGGSQSIIAARGHIGPPGGDDPDEERLYLTSSRMFATL